MIEDELKFEQVARFEEQAGLEIEAAKFAKQAAIQEIGSYITELGQLGANDHEFDSLQEVLSKLEKDEIKPAEALVQARKVMNGKLDYH